MESRAKRDPAEAASLRAGSEPDPYLTPRGFFERYGTPVRTQERWRATGFGPPYVRLGRRVAYRLSDCEAWAAARTFAHRAAELAQTGASSSPTVA
jgi:hypothetical protein